MPPETKPFDAYQRTQKAISSPRDVEYMAFTAMTRGLIEAQSSGEDVALRNKALHANRVLWGTLADDCGREDNTLPEATRAGIISLSIWVAQFTKDAIRSGGDLEPLIEINKIIMAGLSGRAAEPSSAI